MASIVRLSIVQRMEDALQRQIGRMVATCRTMEVARIGPAAAILRRTGVDIPYAFATDDMMLDTKASEALIGDPSIEAEGWLARAPSGVRIPTMSAVIGTEKLDLDARQAGVLMAVTEAPLRVARLAGKIALVEMPETADAPPSFLDGDEEGSYDAPTRLAARALLRVADEAGSGPGAQVVLMGGGRRRRAAP